MLMKLVDSLSVEVSFSPRPDYQSPDDQNRMVKYAIDGTPHIIKPYKKKRYSIPLNNVNLTNASQIITWWEDLEQLTFYPDLENTPATTYTVMITQSQSPLSLMFPKTDIYEGTLEVREV